MKVHIFGEVTLILVKDDAILVSRSKVKVDGNKNVANMLRIGYTFAKTGSIYIKNQNDPRHI